VDGKFLGFCQGQDTYDKLLAIKNTNAFPMGTAIVLIKDDILEVHTDGSRLVRPLAIVGSNGRLEIENKKLWGASTGVLLKQGCLEYVDAYEQEFIKLASSLDTLRFRTESLAKAREAYDKAEAELNSVKGGGRVTYSMMKDGLESTATLTLEEADKRLEQARFALDKLVRSRPYTHCEIDPQAILGISASLIPHPNHIQAPRNNYQSAMGKQALGVYHVHHMDRFDGKTKVLAFPSRPMFETQMAEMLGLNANPQGDTLMVAFGTKSGMTAEDSFVVNQNTVDMGHFRILRTISIRTTVKNTAEVIEQLGRPQLKKDEKAERYQFLGENGLPAIGAYLKQGDAVVGKRQIILASRDERNTSVFLKVGEEGIVRKVYVTGDESSLVVNVKLVMFRTPVEGDKFAPRYAQKGTWSYICPAEDMYFTESGEAIDMLVNPHAIPSRMTMTYIFELIATKAGVLTGDRINATAFRPFDYDEFQRILRLYGYSPQGLEVVYSGTLGTELQVQLYHGPCYIQALKHHVKDKHQVRGKGAVKAVNRQPVKGRLHGGGLRFGEMERDNAAGHGAAYFLQERLCTVSDAYQVIFCTNCGTFALTDIIGQDYTCKHCTVKGQFGRATIPYALKLLFHYLAAAGIFLRFDLKTLDEYREYQEMRARRAASATGLPEDEEEEVIEEGEEEQEEDEHTIDEDESY